MKPTTTKQLRKEREERILISLSSLRFATLEQLRVIHNLKSYKNAHRILHRMEVDKWIESHRCEKKVYFLSNKGKERIGVYTDTKKRGGYEHILMKNDFFIHMGQPSGWTTGVEMDAGGKNLIPDAMYKREGVVYFVEVDYAQSMKNNKEKIARYSLLFESITRDYGRPPMLLYYTASEQRKIRLKKELKAHQLQAKVYTTSSLPYTS